MPYYRSHMYGAIRHVRNMAKHYKRQTALRHRGKAGWNIAVAVAKMKFKQGYRSYRRGRWRR